MKNAALVSVVALVALAVGFYLGHSPTRTDGGSAAHGGRWIPGTNGTYVSEGVDGRGIILWTITDGAAVRARSFYVHTGPGPDGAVRNTVKEDAFTYRPPE